MLEISGQVDPRGIRAGQRIIDSGLCQQVEYYAETDSTNSLALEALSKRVHPDASSPSSACTLYLADHQTAGRGRHGRSWLSSDQNLAFSLLLPHTAYRPAGNHQATENVPNQHGNVQLLPLAVGVGIARSIEFQLAPLATRLKWPNDVYVAGGKVAGILLESQQNHPNWIVIGIGINVGFAPDHNVLAQKSRGPVNPAASLAKAVGRKLHRYDLLQPIIEHVLDAVAQTHDDADALLADFRSRCMLSGQLIQLSRGDHLVQGKCIGISSSGELQLETADGIELIRTGEAQLVRMSTPT